MFVYTECIFFESPCQCVENILVCVLNAMKEGRKPLKH